MKGNISVVLWILLGSIVLLTGCGGGHTPAPGGDPVTPPVVLQPQPLHGTSADGVNCSIHDNMLAVSFTQVTTASQFVRIALPDAMALGEQQWVGVRDTAGTVQALTLAAVTEGGLELAVVPLAGFTGGTIVMNAAVVPPAAASAVESADENEISDLALLPGAFGQVEIHWTQSLPGDYNFDGVVDVADVQAIAEQYGQSILRSGPDADEQTTYWVDGGEDGNVNEGDAAEILEHYGSAVAGYNVRRNGALLPGAAAGQPTIGLDQATRRANLPPQYKLVLNGATSDSFAITPVGPAALEGATTQAASYTADLVVAVTISGVDLADLLDQWPGGSTVTKEGTRVICPGDIIGRPTLAKPVAVAGRKAVYSGLERGKKLMLDIRYLPLKDLATGDSREVSEVLRTCSGTIDDPTGLQYTAIPFELPLNGAPLSIEAQIDITPNPAGGYFIELSATQAVTGQASQSTTLRLSYLDGVLTADSDANGNFSDEAQFLDDDRDQVSNRRLEQEQSESLYPDYLTEPLILQADLVELEIEQGYLLVGNVQGLDGVTIEIPVTQQLLLSEQTIFAGTSDPHSWRAGDRLALDVLRMSNPADERDSIYWVTYAELIGGGDPGGPPQAGFTASQGLEWMIQLDWLPVDSYLGYLIERYQPVPDAVQYILDGFWELGNTPPYTLADNSALPGVEYRYKLYGVTASQGLDLLSEAFGYAVDWINDPANPTVFFGMLIQDAAGGLVIIDDTGTEVQFTWDDATLWTTESNPLATPADFLLGDYVNIAAIEAPDGWYALQVDKPWMWNPQDPTNPPGGR